MARKIRLIIFLILFTPLSQAANTTFKFDSAQSDVEFLAVGKPSMLKIRGKGGKITGELIEKDNKITGNMKVDLNDFDTGMSLRNRHMKEKYLETQKQANRYSELEIIGLSIPALNKDGQEEVPFKGILSLHGVKKEISGNAKVKISGSTYSGNTKLNIKLSDFGIAIPSFAGVTVAEDVSIDIAFKAQIVKRK